jgi:hypothetical protein
MTTTEIREHIAETIGDLEATCRITLFDIYGSADGFYIAEYKVQQEENAEYGKSGKDPDYS